MTRTESEGRETTDTSGFRRTKRFRQLVDSDDILLLPGVHDALSARIAEQAGFQAITACGRICMMRKKINLSTVLAGQRLGIKEVEDGIWLISFMHYDLGYIDLEQRTLQTIYNPFGTRLSPMS